MGNLDKKTNRKIDTIVIHCSATKEGQSFSVEQIDKMHKKNGWAGIGYHFVVYLDGSVHDGRDIGKVGAHVSGHNVGSIGICYIGGLDKKGNAKDTRTYQQKNGLYQLVKRLMQMYPIKVVKGHRDFSPDTNHNGKVDKYERIKACPCFEVSEWMEESGLNEYLS